MIGSVSLHCRSLVMRECTCGVINLLYHSRYNDGYRQYEYDHGISCIIVLYILIHVAEISILEV